MNTTSPVFQPVSLPDLIVVGRQLTKLVYNSSENLYEIQAVIALVSPTYRSDVDSKIVLAGEFIFVAVKCFNQSSPPSYETSIIKFSQELKQLDTSSNFPDLAALATNGETLFISTQGNFVSLNQDLETLHEVGLEVTPANNKNAHDILIYQNTAYLLDNIVYPVFILRADITNPQNLQITATINIEDIYPHLLAQWLNPSLNQWCVIQSFSSDMGEGTKVRIYPLKGGDEQIALQSMSHDQKGIDIIAVTERSPIWAIIRDEGQRLCLANVNSEDNIISFEKSLYLEDLTIDELERRGYKVKIKSQNNDLFILIGNPWEARLLVVNMEFDGAPKLVLDQQLDLEYCQDFELLSKQRQLAANQPRSDDAVFGGQSSLPLNAAVLGGLEAAKRSLASRSHKHRIQALSEALKYGSEGLKLVDQIVRTETGSVQWAAYNLLWERGDITTRNQLLAFFPLNSAVGIDYTLLRDLLAAQQWQAANEETVIKIQKLCGGTEEMSRGRDIRLLPCEDLHTIDQLWVKSSNGHFGFSVQNRIYKSIDGTIKYNSNEWTAFATRLGWRVKGFWLTYSKFIFAANTPEGHLPVLWERKDKVIDHTVFHSLMRRMSTCRIL